MKKLLPPNLSISKNIIEAVAPELARGEFRLRQKDAQAAAIPKGSANLDIWALGSFNARAWEPHSLSWIFNTARNVGQKYARIAPILMKLGQN